MDEQAAANDANRLIAGLGLQGTSPRALMAAAALAFEADARGYAARTAGVRVLDKLVKEQAKGTRASDFRAAADWEAIDADDQQSGERLGDLLAG